MNATSAAEVVPAQADEASEPLSGKDGGITTRHGQLWLVIVLTAMTMLSTIDKNIMALLLDAIKSDLTLSDTQISIMFSLAFASVYTLSAIPAGRAADRWSRRSICGGAGILWSGMTMMCAMPFGYWGLVLCRMGVGLGEGALGPSAQSLVCDGVGLRNRGKALATVSLAPTLGAGSAMLLGGFVYSLFPAGGLHLPLIGLLHPWQLTLIAVGAFGIPISLLCWTIMEPVRLQRGIVASPDDGWRPAIAYVAQRWMLYLPLLIIILAQLTITAVYGAWIPSVIKRSWGLTSWEIGKSTGLILLIFGPCGAWLASTLVGRITRVQARWGMPLLALCAAIACGLSAACAPLVSDIRIFFTLFACMAIFSITPVTNVTVAVSRVTPPEIRGRVFGLQYLAVGLFALTLAPTIVALISDYGFSHLGPQAIASGVATLCALVSLASVFASLALFHPYARSTADY